MESAKHRHNRGSFWSAQIRVTDGGRGVWFVQRGVGEWKRWGVLRSQLGSPRSWLWTCFPPPSNLWAVAMAVLLRILMIEEKCGFSVAASGMHVQLLILKCVKQRPVKQRPVKVRSTLQRQLRYLVFAGDKCEATAAWEHCRAGLSFHLCTQLWACWTTLMTK